MEGPSKENRAKAPKEIVLMENVDITVPRDAYLIDVIMHLGPSTFIQKKRFLVTPDGNFKRLCDEFEKKFHFGEDLGNQFFFYAHVKQRWLIQNDETFLLALKNFGISRGNTREPLIITLLNCAAAKRNASQGFPGEYKIYREIVE
ncbi:unnamed protein product [Caenorhabditis bovis]|uniref:Uncharacterized protein n=1 Tax=Caenorhabditis bovis TaxID=2654633 RepID=A0A8S1E461_9PELO|nr:unnamed protein product [Caenorhabditis bovis]